MGPISKFCAVSAVLFASGCGVDSGVKDKGADGYYFEGKEYEELRAGVEVVLYPSRAKFDKVAKEKLKGLTSAAMFSILRRDGDKYTCEIHMVDPEVEYLPEFLGHELTHCMWGRWHNKQNEKRENLGLRPKGINATNSTAAVGE